MFFPQKDFSVFQHCFQIMEAAAEIINEILDSILGAKMRKLI